MAKMQNTVQGKDLGLNPHGGLGAQVQHASSAEILKIPAQLPPNLCDAYIFACGSHLQNHPDADTAEVVRDLAPIWLLTRFSN